MKWVILAALMALSACSASELYTDKYDDLNVDEVLANKRLLIAYFNCILDNGQCTPEGKELKIHIKEAMESSCSKCTEKQRQKVRKVVNYVKNNEKDYWEQLKAKYDPGNKNKDSYEAFLAADN